MPSIPPVISRFDPPDNKALRFGNFFRVLACSNKGLAIAPGRGRFLTSPSFRVGAGWGGLALFAVVAFPALLQRSSLAFPVTASITRGGEFTASITVDVEREGAALGLTRVRLKMSSELGPSGSHSIKAKGKKAKRKPIVAIAKRAQSALPLQAPITRASQALAKLQNMAKTVSLGIAQDLIPDSSSFWCSQSWVVVSKRALF